MNKIFIGSIVNMLIVISAFGGQTQFYGENWFRYTQKMKEGETQESEFNVKRIYFRWKHIHTDKLESRISLEMFSSDKSKDEKGDPHGAGLKIKDGYVKFKGFIPEGDVTVGLQKNYFGRVYDWEYWPIEKCIGERYKVIPGSRDYGVSIGGYIPQGYGTWRLAAVNGEGYKKVGDLINTELAYMADLRFIPIPGFTIGGSYVQENSGVDEYQKKQYYTGLARIAKGPVDIWMQYLGGQKGDFDNPTTQMGYMIFPKFHLGTILNKDVEIFARYDCWDPDTDEEDDGKFLYLGGFNYYFSRREKGKPDVMLQTVFVREQSEASDSEPTDKIMLQLRWGWSTPKFGEL